MCRAPNTTTQIRGRAERLSGRQTGNYAKQISRSGAPHSEPPVDRWGPALPCPTPRKLNTNPKDIHFFIIIIGRGRHTCGIAGPPIHTCSKGGVGRGDGGSVCILRIALEGLQGAPGAGDASGTDGTFVTYLLIGFIGLDRSTVPDPRPSKP